VYTPPAQRGKGYAANCTAAVSQLLLDAGWDYCALFTDLENPISNRVYEKIGYEAVCDYADYHFAQPR
jgi:predicted GNAT family acetyltransferase